MRLRRSAFAMAVLITGVVSESGADAGTVTTVQSGWWNEAAVGPLAVPTTTPPDQLQVSNGLAGPLAFAAVRISPATGTPATDTVTLKLPIPSGSTVGTPDVSACVTTSPWKPGADQAAKAAPGYSCNRGFQAAGTISGSTESWTVPLAWESGGSISLALVPTPSTTTPFSITYDQPTVADVTFVVAPPSSSVPTTPATTPAIQYSAPVDNTVSPPTYTVPAPFGGGSPTASVVAPSVPAPPSGGSAAAAVPRGTPTPVAAPSSAAPGGGTAPPPAPSQVPRLVAFILLIFVGVALFGLAGQPDRAPQLLGALGDRIVVGRRAAPPAPVPAAADAPAPMGGGARIRAHRAARLARTRGLELIHHGTPAVTSGGVYGAPPVIAPVRGIGRFARPRHGPPRRI